VEPDLDEAITALAAALASRLVAEAREEAVAELRAELAGRLNAELLRLAEIELGLEEPSPRLAAAVEGTGAAALGCYVYGVVRSGTPIPRELVGVEPGEPVRPLEFRGLAALVSEVSLEGFDGAGLRRNVADVAWLEKVERGHERVLAGALAAAAVVPLRLGSVLAEEEVVQMLRRDYGLLLDALERLDSRAEWNVKVVAAEGAIEREALRRAGRAASDRIEEPPPGTGWAREIHADLSALAVEALRNPLPPLPPDGHGGEMLLNGVYLVDDEQACAFRAAARELAERFERRGVEVVVDGPCPAHNFVKVSIEAAR
jgi:hypothetical protein